MYSGIIPCGHMEKCHKHFCCRLVVVVVVAVFVAGLSHTGVKCVKWCIKAKFLSCLKLSFLG